MYIIHLYDSLPPNQKVYLRPVELPDPLTQIIIYDDRNDPLDIYQEDPAEVNSCDWHSARPVPLQIPSASRATPRFSNAQVYELPNGIVPFKDETGRVRILSRMRGGLFSSPP